jgi:AcrR family transcriptional regulator
MQRARLMAAAAAVIAERGYAGTSVGHICRQARISRRTFYDLFESREDCLFAVLEDAVRVIKREIDAAGLQGCAWRDRVRGGLFVVLSFFDHEPMLARVCVVQALQAGPRVAQWREDVLARLVEAVDEGRGGSARSRQCTALTAEGLVGAAFAIVYARLLTGKHPGPLSGLLGELMSLIVLPYLGPAAARSERQRAVPPPPKSAAQESARDVALEGDPLRVLPMRLTYRTARVLDSIAANPGASNSSVAEHSGISDQGQVSKLLARLKGLGLLTNAGEGHSKGEPNAWQLTPTGVQVRRSIQIS